MAKGWLAPFKINKAAYTWREKGESYVLGFTTYTFCGLSLF